MSTSFGGRAKIDSHVGGSSYWQEGKSGGQLESLTKHSSEQRHAVLWQVLASLNRNHCNIPEDRTEGGRVLPLWITDVEARPVQPEGCRADEDCQCSPQQLRGNHRPWICHRLHEDNVMVLFLHKSLAVITHKSWCTDERKGGLAEVDPHMGTQAGLWAKPILAERCGRRFSTLNVMIVLLQ